jgi:general secretion pathway protein L
VKLSVFLHWWWRQLKTLLPAAWRRFWEPVACVLHLQLTAEETLTYYARIQKEIFSGADRLCTANAPQGHTELQQFIAQLPRSPSHLILQVPSAQYVFTEVELPLVAEQHLRQTISFQIPQLTPFTTDEVVFFHGIQRRDATQKKLFAWLLVIPLKTLRMCLGQLPGISLAAAQQPDQPPSVGKPLQLTYRLARQQSVWSWRNPATIGVLISLALAGVLGLHGYQQWQSREHVRQHLVVVQQQATEATHLRQQLTQVQQQVTTLSQYQTSAVPVLAVWHDITRRLADDTWLHQFEIQGRELFLQGVTTDAAALIPLLEASPYLHQVSFMASVVRDPQSQQDRFHIGASVAPVQTD